MDPNSHIGKDWLDIELSEIAETGSGGTPLRSKHSEYYNGSIPWVKSGELRDNVIFTTEENINEKALKESSSKLVPKDSILIALYGATVGNLAMLGIDAATNQAVCFIIPDKKVIQNRFVFYFLKTRVNDLMNQRVGGAQPNISQQIIKKIKIPLPSLSEQKKIVEILEQADELKRLKKEAQEKSEKILTALFYKMFGDPVKNEKGWKIDKLKNLIKINYGESLSSEERINGKYAVFGSNGIVGYHNEYLIGEQAIIVGRKGSAGSINLIDEPSYPIDTTFYILKSESFVLNFLYYLLKLVNLKKLSIVTGVPGINREDIYNEKVIIPSINLQKRFSEIFIEVTKLQKDVEINNTRINKILNILLHNAFSGELTKNWREENKRLIDQELRERQKKYGF